MLIQVKLLLQKDAGRPQASPGKIFLFSSSQCLNISSQYIRLLLSFSCLPNAIYYQQ
jgi:hypothetical protein